VFSLNKFVENLFVGDPEFAAGGTFGDLSFPADSAAAAPRFGGFCFGHIWPLRNGFFGIP
jgi:hypothetical protein